MTAGVSIEGLCLVMKQRTILIGMKSPDRRKCQHHGEQDSHQTDANGASLLSVAPLSTD